MRNVDIEEVEAVEVQAPSPDGCEKSGSVPIVNKTTAILTQSCDEADTVRQRESQAEGVKLRINSGIAIH